VGRRGRAAGSKDRYGVSWQIVPKVLYELIGDPNREKSQRVMAAMLKMKKIEIAELERAAAAA
jgi:predicted 3-demethylubiquinone-9 3-methyltransferase (glyoxalase superfamily)